LQESLSVAHRTGAIDTKEISNGSRNYLTGRDSPGSLSAALAQTSKFLA